MHRPSRAHHVLLDHQAAHVVGAVEQRELADLAALRHPTRLNVDEVVEVEPGDRLRLQVFERAGGRDVVHRGVVGLKRPADKGGEAAGLVLQLAEAVEVLHPLRERLDVAIHHRRRATAAEQVPLPAHLQPLVGHRLATGDGRADAVHEDLTAAAGERPEAGAGEPLEHLPQRPLRDLGERVDLGR